MEADEGELMIWFAVAFFAITVGILIDMLFCSGSDPDDWL